MQCGYLVICLWSGITTSVDKRRLKICELEEKKIKGYLKCSLRRGLWCVYCCLTCWSVLQYSVVVWTFGILLLNTHWDITKQTQNHIIWGRLLCLIICLVLHNSTYFKRSGIKRVEPNKGNPVARVSLYWVANCLLRGSGGNGQWCGHSSGLLLDPVYEGKGLEGDCVDPLGQQIVLQLLSATRFRFLWWWDPLWGSV